MNRSLIQLEKALKLYMQNRLKGGNLYSPQLQVGENFSIESWKGEFDQIPRSS